MEIITLKEMLDIMEMRGEDGQPIPFSMRFITCNRKAKTGGKRIEVKDVVLVGGAVSKSTVKNQNHHSNFTRNFRSVNNEEVRQFHPPLVEMFNNLRVVM